MRRIGNGGLGRKYVEYEKKYSHVVLKRHKQCQSESVDSLVKASYYDCAVGFRSFLFKSTPFKDELRRRKLEDFNR